MIGSPQPAPCLRPLPVKWSHQVQLLPKEPKCIISEIKFNPHTYNSEVGAVIIPICQMRQWRLKEVIISSRGRVGMKSVYREFQRPVRAVFMVGRQGTLRASGAWLSGEGGFVLSLSSSFFPSDSESPLFSLLQGFLVLLWFVPFCLPSLLPAH